MRRHLISLTTLLIAATPAFSDTLSEAKAAYDAAWDQAPLAVQRAEFVSKHTENYGSPTVRQTNVFNGTEPLLIYVEPIGFGYLEGDDLNVLGITYDLRLLNTSGLALIQKEDFVTVKIKSAGRPKEFFNNLTLTLAGLPPAKYVVELTLNDLASDETAILELPFQIQ